MTATLTLAADLTAADDALYTAATPADRARALARIDRLRREIGCSVPEHDHGLVTSNDGGDPNDNRCNDCREPIHYDRSVEDYQHDDPTAECFLVGYHEQAIPCELRPRAVDEIPETVIADGDLIGELDSPDGPFYAVIAATPATYTIDASSLGGDGPTPVRLCRDARRGVLRLIVESDQ